MTPGIKVAKNNKINYRVHAYTHDASRESYGSEAAEKMGISAARVFKTLVVSLADQSLAVGVVPVCAKLSMKRMASALGVKHAAMAAPSDVERSTGYVLGGVSPLGQKRRLKTVIDCSAEKYATIFVSAGRRGLEIELKPDDLKKLVGGVFADLCQ